MEKGEILMSIGRDNMISSLKKIVIPVLREKGFKGSFPHFRRISGNKIDLITFQFNRWGGSFIVELASCPLEGTTMDWGEKVLPNKVTAHHINERFRLGAKSMEEDGQWFDFEDAAIDEDYNRVSNNVLDLFNTSDSLWSFIFS